MGASIEELNVFATKFQQLHKKCMTNFQNVVLLEEPLKYS